MLLSTLRRFAATACVLAGVALAVPGCATWREYSSGPADDPFEPLNRQIHALNKTADRHVVRPATQAYDAVTPDLVQFLVRNALSHLTLPRDFASNTLSGRWEEAGLTAARFGINTVVGAGGLLDPAADFGVDKQEADIGQALARLGAPAGVYYEAPLLGPTTVRHTIGRLVDFALSPTLYLIGPAAAIGETGLRLGDARLANQSAIDSVLYDSPDSYTTSKVIYLQLRARSIRDTANDGGVDDADDLEIILE